MNKDNPPGAEGNADREEPGAASGNTDTDVQRFPVVGIGSSAGGLNALESLFRSMPGDSGMAFVLVPHLDPTHKSILAEIITRFTPMTVTEITDGMRIATNNVYVIPPNNDLELHEGRFKLLRPAETRGLRHSIDSFFRSLGRELHDMAIGIILSGTGSEGTLGLQAIRGEGGLVIVQDPDTAEYDSMPMSAMANEAADFVLPPEKIPDKLIAFANRFYGTPGDTPEEASAAPVSALQQIMNAIRSQTGYDFSHYKKNLISRRTERRMSLLNVGSIDEYARLLRENPTEALALYKEFLIGTTSFFRDPEFFAAVKSQVVPELFRDVSGEEPIRVWVPGCSTGEEAYSLAMAFQEYFDEQNRDARVTIFATDINNDAVDFARRGTYPDSISVDVSPERLQRFFTRDDGSFRIKDQIRDMLIFAPQSVTRDPPFSKMDLVSCRNLLIYLGPELQKRLHQILFYALKPDRFLLLGTSESLSATAEQFTVVNARQKIFKRKWDAVLPFLPSDALHHRGTGLIQPIASARDHETKPLAKNIGELTEGLLLRNYTPACVIVNEPGDILYIHGNAGKYLELPAGQARMNIFFMTGAEIRSELGPALREAAKSQQRITVEGLQTQTGNDAQSINLIVQPVEKSHPLHDTFMVIFEDLPPRKPLKKAIKTRRRPGKLRDEDFINMENELRNTRQNLQDTIERLQAANEELQSGNEELQSGNEELQSTNEELETSKEELQSVNEELVTVNAENQDRLNEMSEIKNDMDNLLASTNIATIFLDINMKIRGFTPAATRIFRLLQSDTGRPLEDFASTLSYGGLVDDALEVIETLATKEVTVEDNEGGWLLTRIMPYRTRENVIDGAVMTFVDVTRQQQLEADLASSRRYFRDIVETVREPLLVLDAGVRVVTANKAFYATFRLDPDDVEGQELYVLGGGQWDQSRLRKLLEEIIPEKTTIEEYEISHIFPDTREMTFVLNARRIVQEEESSELILLAFEEK